MRLKEVSYSQRTQIASNKGDAVVPECKKSIARFVVARTRVVLVAVCI